MSKENKDPKKPSKGKDELKKEGEQRAHNEEPEALSQKHKVFNSKEENDIIEDAFHKTNREKKDEAMKKSGK